MGGGGASDRRRKKGDGWTMGQSGRVGRMPLGPARRENKQKSGMGCKDDCAEIKGGLQKNSFSNFESRI
jgi:hypothetical protein